MSNVIQNASKGYGYNYASLADIANQGHTIPKMKTATEDGKEYVFYYDKELKDWIRGAEVVVPDGKGMNKAQLYGSALTYARRYTTQLALSLACSDDALVEDIDDKGEKKSARKAEKVDEKQINDLRAQMYKTEEKPLSQAEKAWLVKNYKIKSDKEITPEMVAELRKLQEAKRNAAAKTNKAV